MSANPYCFKNGKLVKLNAMRIAANDLGILRGYGIFDFMRTYNGKPFLMDEHVARFERSAKRMGLVIPYKKTELKRIALSLIKKNNFSDTILKFVLTGGPSEDGITLPAKPTFYVLAGRAFDFPESCYSKGVHLQTHEYMRLIPEVKTLNYIESVRHQKELKKRGILELLFVFEGKVLECSSSNILLIKNNVLITPESDVLSGTTRNFVMKMAGSYMKTVMREVKVSELFTADEVFITASNKAIMPVTKINGKKIGTGKPGAHTKKLLALYLSHLKGL